MSITDDDDPIVTVSFEQATYTLAENDDTTTEVKENEVTVKVVRSADPERRVQLNLFRSHQGGAPPRDYEFTPDCFCVYFDAGDTEESITITAVNDSVNDDGESLSLTFGAKPTRVSEGTTNEAVVSITDDDKPHQPDRQLRVRHLHRRRGRQRHPLGRPGDGRHHSHHQG